MNLNLDKEKLCECITDLSLLVDRQRMKLMNTRIAAAIFLLLLVVESAGLVIWSLS